MSCAVDTSVWIDYFRDIDSRHARSLHVALASERIFVPDLVLMEVLRGISSRKAAVWVESVLDNLEIVQVGGQYLVVQAAENFRFLRSKGITIRGTIDLMIGTWCIENKIPLLHNDRDFDMLEQHLGLICVTLDDFQ